jgi:hypothetical protein
MLSRHLGSRRSWNISVNIKTPLSYAGAGFDETFSSPSVLWQDPSGRLPADAIIVATGTDYAVWLEALYQFSRTFAGVGQLHQRVHNDSGTFDLLLAASMQKKKRLLTISWPSEEKQEIDYQITPASRNYSNQIKI